MSRIDHVNIVVRDIRATTSFYRDVIGLRVTREITIQGDWIETITGLKDVEADVVYLETDAGAGLELIQYRRPSGARPDGLGAPNTPGIRHIAFRTTDLDGTVAALKTAGVDLLSQVRQVPESQVDFAGAKKRILYCRDPEGNLLELCDYEHD